MNVSELSYVDAVRTLVRTTVLIKLSEVNSESSTEFRDIDAVRTVVRTTFLIPLANVSELRYVDEVRTAVKTTVLLLHLYKYSNLCSIYVIMKRIFV